MPFWTQEVWFSLPIGSCSVWDLLGFDYGARSAWRGDVEAPGGSTLLWRCLWPDHLEIYAPGPGRATKLYTFVRDSDNLFLNLSCLLCVHDAAFDIINPPGTGLCCRMYQWIPRLGLEMAELISCRFFFLFAELSLLLPWMREKLLQP